MSFETPDNEKYYPGFDPEWLNDPELQAKAKALADFYTKQFDDLALEVGPDEEVLVHFSPEVVEGDIANNSAFYDGGREKLTQAGFDFAEFDDKFGDNKCVVAIPLKAFQQWIDSLSWLKLTQAGVLENATVMAVPKQDIILRDSRFTDNAFRLVADGSPNATDLTKEKLAYFQSTTAYNPELLEDPETMWEAWIPHQVSLDNSQTINYQEKQK